MLQPTRKGSVTGNWKSITPAAKEMMMDSDVAKPVRQDFSQYPARQGESLPFAMLSLYLITRAVTRPPKTWHRTVAMAHPPKFPKSHVGASEPAVCVVRKGAVPLRSRSENSGNRAARKAGGKLKRVSWTLRTQRFAEDPLRTFSK